MQKFLERMQTQFGHIEVDFYSILQYYTSMKQGFGLAVIFCTSIWVSGCSSIQGGFTQGYDSARENPIRTMTLEEIEQARRSVGLRDSDYYREKRLRDALRRFDPDE